MTTTSKQTYSPNEETTGSIAAMTIEDSKTLELTSLELKVDELIKTIEKLSDENEQLRTESGHLALERLALLEKTEQARTRVEAMIARLKAMEIR